MEIKGYQFNRDLDPSMYMPLGEHRDFYRVYLKWSNSESLSFIASKSEKDSLLSTLPNGELFILNIYGEDDVEKFSLWVNPNKLSFVQTQKG
jgi:hypothetical protein